MDSGTAPTEPEQERTPTELEPREVLQLALDPARQELLDAIATGQEPGA